MYKIKIGWFKSVKYRAQTSQTPANKDTNFVVLLFSGHFLKSSHYE
jgi:hypothetical protein